MTEELKPVRCGCGGEAKVKMWAEPDTPYLVMCERCKASSGDYATEAEAVTAWNKAMGAKDINVPNKERTAKVKEGWGLAVCECGRRVFEGDIYCSHCGCRLDWNEDIPMEYFESGGK